MLISLAAWLLCSNPIGGFFPGYAPLPNPKPADCEIIAIPAQPRVEFDKEVTT